MKTIMRSPKLSVSISLVVLFVLAFTNVNAQIIDKDDVNTNKPETEITADIYWQVKAYHPEAKLLRVKAIDKDGNIHDVKAIQDSYDTSVLNVKALVNGKRLPIKLIVRDNEPFYSAKAIADDGTLIDIKALTDKGEILDIKGVNRSGNVIQLRAISNESVFYNIIAVSPNGNVNSVKGLKMLDGEVETVISGVSVFAHVKAVRQN